MAFVDWSKTKLNLAFMKHFWTVSGFIEFTDLFNQ